MSVGGSAEYAYAYDMENRLRGVSGTGVGTYPTSYAYNANGSLLSATYSNVTYPQRNDGVDATSPLLWDGQVLHTPGSFSEDDAGTEYYYEPDLLGSSVGVMMAAGSQQTTYEWDGFGVLQGSWGTSPEAHPLQDGFAGGAGYQEEAGTGGLVRCGNRFYNPYFGRFVTQDPAGAGMNWYTYCDNDPTTNLDPTGLDDGGDDGGDGSAVQPGFGQVPGTTDTLPDGTVFTTTNIPGNTIFANYGTEAPGDELAEGAAASHELLDAGRRADNFLFFGLGQQAMTALGSYAGGQGSGLRAAELCTGLVAVVALTVVTGGTDAVAVDSGKAIAGSIADHILLKRSLASAAQVGEKGVAIAGAGAKSQLRDAPRLAAEYGGDASDWAKMTSTQYDATITDTGAWNSFQTHWYENVSTGKQVEFKTVIPH